jgi:hypothetical protein
MNQVPVGRSIAHAYGFLFGRILTIVALSWVAGLFFAGLRFGLFQAGPISQPIGDHLQTVAIHLAGLLGALALVSIIALPLTREALGSHGKWTLAHFTFAAPEFSLFLALVRLYVVLIAVIAIAVLAVVGAGIGVKLALVQWPAIGKSGVPLALVAPVATCVIASLAVLYAGLRLSFFLYPVAAAEEHASLRSAWALGKGNVLRILLVTLAILIPVYVVVFGCEYALLGQSFLDILGSLASGKAHDADALVMLFLAHAGAISAGAAVLMVVMVSLSAGASAAAYRAVKGIEDHAAPASDDSHGHHDHGHEAPAAAHHDDGHGDHGHGDHGHGGHDDHAAQGDGDHGHDDHGHSEHGHDDHGHDAHGHDEHGHDDHGGHAQDDHANDDHGHDNHGHDEHGHGDHAHAAPDDHDGHGHGDAHGEDAHGHAGHGHGGDDHGHGADHHAHAAEKLDHAA